MSFALVKNVRLLDPTPDGSRPRLGVPYLSPSQIKSFDRCESAYYARYGKGHHEPGKPSMLLGTASHQFAETWHELAIAGAIAAVRFDDAMQAALRVIQTELAEDPAFRWDEAVWYKGPQFDLEWLKRRLETVAGLLVPTLERYDPLRLEQGYLIEWADGKTLPVLAFTDLVGRDRESLKAVVDYKTSGKEKSINDLMCDQALTAYALGEGWVSGDQMVPDVRYVNIVTTKEMRVLEIRDVRREDDVRRLYNAARIQTLKMAAGLFGMANSPFACNNCWHREWCEASFGGRRPRIEQDAPPAARDAASLELVTA